MAIGRPKGTKDKIKRSHSYCFSRQFLNDHGLWMRRGDEQILKPVEHLYDIKLPNTRYFIGQQFREQGEIQVINSYEMLKEKGFVIVSRKVSARERWESNQVVVYELRRAVEGQDHVGKFPGGKYGAFAEFDAYNRAIRLVGARAGPLGYGPWLQIDQESSTYGRDGGRPLSFKSYGAHGDELINEQINQWLGIEAEPEPIYIKEAAFMITDANEIVCFPRLPDMPSILISGMKGTGKSFCLHSLVSRFFWKPAFNFKIVILNDSSRETGTWCYPNSDPKLIKILKRLNERPLPLPCVYLHPKVKEDYETLYMGSVGFFITIPFKEVVENHKEYLKIEGSTRYFTKFKSQLASCATQAEAEGLLETISVSHSVPPNTANKIRAEFETLFDTKMTDISSKKQFPWVVSKSPNKEYNPLTACIHAGVLPVLQTEYVSNKRELLSIYFTYFVKDLFMRQKQDLDFVKDRSELLLVVDEAHNISQKSIKSGADMLLRRCVREGRPRRIGTLLATQKFSELPDVIKDNSTYLICFKNPGEANQIANQYKMGKSVAQMITDLDKHECIAYSTDYFVVYDSNGNRRKSKVNEVFRGRTLPPFSEHKRPMKKGS